MCGDTDESYDVADHGPVKDVPKAEKQRLMHEALARWDEAVKAEERADG